jgi:hypothetical protein
LPVAGAVSTLVAGPVVIPALTLKLILEGLGLALLLPVVPFSLEMYALRRLSTAAFGTLMCLEPAIALIAGIGLLHQLPRGSSLAGVAFVVTAGIGAERSGARQASRSGSDPATHEATEETTMHPTPPSPSPGPADLAHRRHLEKTVSWTGRERLRCLWYRLRLTVAEMNYATRRIVEPEVVRPPAS